MKLNEHGWGLNTLLIVGTIFIVLLIGVSVAIKSFIDKTKNSDKDNKTESVSVYETLERDLKTAGESYASYHNTLVTLSNDSLIVSYDELHNDGYIDSLYVDDNENCTGYVAIQSDGNVLPYIKCDNYTTSEYYDRIN